MRVWWGSGTVITNFETAATNTIDPNVRVGVSLPFDLDTADPLTTRRKRRWTSSGCKAFGWDARGRWLRRWIRLARLLMPEPRLFSGLRLRGYPMPSYQWRWHGTNLARATASSLAIPSVLNVNEGPYDVVMTNSYGSVTSALATLTVIDPVINTQPASRTNNARYHGHVHGVLPRHEPELTCGRRAARP